MTKTRHIQVVAWGISVIVGALAFLVWGQGIDWRFSELSMYRIFPLFGLVAFSVMWSHYMASALRQHFQLDKTALHHYFEVTSSMVLGALLLHPGLLAWQLWQDGLGWPPGSYKEYVGAALYGFVLLGATAWLLFLAYELRRVYGKRPWWRFVQYASDGAMFLVFFHALKLGGELQRGWFRGVWYFYGVTLAGVLIYTYVPKFRPSNIAKKT